MSRLHDYKTGKIKPKEKKKEKTIEEEFMDIAKNAGININNLN